MQRAIYALVALLTLIAAVPLSVQAQDGTEKPSEPASQPQRIENHSGAGVISQDREPGPDATVNLTDEAQALVVRPDETVANVVVRDRPLILEGHVKHDVMAVNCDVIVKRGATVGNVVDVIGGTVDNRAGDAVHVVRQDAGVVSLLDGTLAVPAVQVTHEASPRRPASWSGGQFALLLLGLLIGLVLSLSTPRAARETSDMASTDRGRSLAYGLIGVVLMVPGLLLGSLVLRSPFSLLLSPFVAAFALICAGLLAYGWLCGMAEAGTLLQRRLGLRQAGWYSQAAFGLIGFFLMNLVLGGIHRNLGALGLLLEGVFALIGLGAAMTSGFGADPNWLSARLKGEMPWLARTSRL